MTCACARIKQTYGHCMGERKPCDYPCYAIKKLKQPSCWEKTQLPKENVNERS